jgi:PleD family two-component response regulator
MRDIVLKYPVWQEPYRAAVIEANPKLLRDKIATAEQAVKLRLQQLENSADHHHELALTDALTALKILAETHWFE